MTHEIRGPLTAICGWVSLMQAGQKWGMQTMNQALLAAIVDKKIAPEVALERSSDPNELDEMMNKVNVRVSI